jgi:hypothetical protein
LIDRNWRRSLHKFQSFLHRPMSDPLPITDSPLHPHQPDQILAAIIGEEADFKLRPSDCPSREEFQQQLSPVVLPAPVQPAPPQRIRFSVSDLLVVMVGISVGLAGGTWIAPSIFAGLMGLVTLVGLLLVHLYPPQSHTGRLVWGTTVLAYVLAVLAAIFRQA